MSTAKKLPKVSEPLDPEKVVAKKPRKDVVAKKKAAAKKGARKKTAKKTLVGLNPKYPRHSLDRALRIPRAIFEQNAGKSCSNLEAASFVGVSNNGPFGVEISSASKFGLLERPTAGSIQPTALARKIIRPQASNDELNGLREALLKAPEISSVYSHYRGENLPDDKFMKNTLAETFGIPEDKFEEFKQIFLDSLERAQLIERHGDKIRILDETTSEIAVPNSSNRQNKALKDAGVQATDTCFVMQPFASPLGGYFEKIYEPAIHKAGLRPVRADNEIFGTGKIIDQVWEGINAARVLVAELTGRNPNVFYELGLAHAMQKPVVLVCANGTDDVPFDLQHIRVIYYDTTDPFWGNKLIDKVSENILSALLNPEEAIFKAIQA